MKKLLTLITILMLTGILAACGNDDNVTETPQNNDTTTDGQNNTTTDDTGSNDTNNNVDQTSNNNNQVDFNTDYIFRSFDLEVDIENDDDAIDIDFEEDRDDNEIEASYEHRPENIDLRGNEAMEELDSIFTSFQFDENTPDDEVIDEVLEAFNIQGDVAKVDLEIEFKNGTEKEYRR